MDRQTSSIQQAEIYGSFPPSQPNFGGYQFLPIPNLVGGLEHFLFSHILGIIIPIDFHIFQRGSNHQPEI